MPSKTSYQVSKDYSDSIQLLWFYLQWKVYRYHGPWHGTTESINERMQKLVRDIDEHELFNSLGGYEFKTAFSKLKEGVNALDHEYELSMMERDDLLMGMIYVYKEANFRERLGKEEWVGGENWVAPPFESCLGQEEARKKASGKSWKGLSWGKAKALVLRGGKDVHV